jgi:hypothetical protein
MSRDFILVFGGGMVSLITTLVVLFVADFFYRYERERQARAATSQPATTRPPALALQPAVAIPAERPAPPSSPPKPVTPSVVTASTEKPAATPVADKPAPAPAEKPSEPPPFPPPPETISKRET